MVRTAKFRQSVATRRPTIATKLSLSRTCLCVDVRVCLKFSVPTQITGIHANTAINPYSLRVRMCVCALLSMSVRLSAHWGSAKCNRQQKVRFQLAGWLVGVARICRVVAVVGVVAKRFAKNPHVKQRQSGRLAAAAACASVNTANVHVEKVPT